MIFEPESSFYVKSDPNLSIHQKKFLIFSKWWIFYHSLLFSWKNSVFANISWFSDLFWKIIFSSSSSSNKGTNRCKYRFCSSICSRDICEKQKSKNQLDHAYFCYLLYNGHIFLVSDSVLWCIHQNQIFTLLFVQLKKNLCH